MPNPFNSEVGQQNKTSGSGVTSKRTSETGKTGKPGPMKTASWPGLPGKSGPSRGSAPKHSNGKAMTKGL